MSGKVPYPGEKDPKVIVGAVRDLYAGRSNAVGEVTLVANTTPFTTVTAINCGLDTKIFLTPASANGAAELALGKLYVSAVDGGTFTITHSANSSFLANRKFFWVGLG